MSDDGRQRTLLALGKRGAEISLLQSARRLALSALRHPRQTARMVQGMGEVADRHETLTRRFGDAGTVLRTGGAFNTLDLSVWVALAESAGVPAIPARPILSLSEAELSALSGLVDTSKLVSTALKDRAARLAESLPEDPLPTSGASPHTPGSVDMEALREKLFAAMDDQPHDTMVRAAYCGPETLKTLAGVGTLADRAPEVAVTRDLSVGPGWVRVGNRRAVDASDLRVTGAYMEGRHGADLTFYARPWVQASRWLECEDPHTVGTPLAATGRWPAEWRAFVYDGQVTGVAAYYGWAGEAGPHEARVALLVRERAQRMVDDLRRCGGVPMLASIEHMRHGKTAETIDERLPPNGIHATLDFIETGTTTSPDVTFLEGGPPFDPFCPGGHPCAFAGIARPDGVAFKLMEGVFLPEPRTWMARDPGEREKDFPGLSRDGAIYDWHDVEALAASGVTTTPDEVSRPSWRLRPG